jgi:probable rRNA maturation factor
MAPSFRDTNAAGRLRHSGADITVHNRQRAVKVRISALEDFARGALREVLKTPGKKNGALATLEDLSVILVSDWRMAELHHRFFNLSGPTDVITFQHGEIFVSTETARRNARRFGTSLEHELRLYIAHGLLHLHGFDDKDLRGSARMKRVQEKLVASQGAAV